VEGVCKHACGIAGRQCECPRGSPTECHVCCRTDDAQPFNTTFPGTCESVFNAENATFLVSARFVEEVFMSQTHPLGTRCNGRLGVCVEGGRCDLTSKHPEYGRSAVNIVDRRLLVVIVLLCTVLRFK